MKIVLLVVGKTDDSCWNEALKEYLERLKHYISFEIKVIPDVKNMKSLTETQQKDLEGAAVLKSLQPGDNCVLLDEKGEELTSVQFAARLEKKINSAPKRLVFVVGGPYGFSEDVYQAISEKIALSKMTFSHQMIRPIFVEQLYRAMTILRNESYHHN
ncbi:MAG: 23S rRNA (pseudouridine(1915)-N(3))-methyltransferase RlmH [Tannerella sp.]|jgi:23S rRNA (pseudouridine1915-N3)-methyltransferase|nr:23S rRNA (pseudouridine(1915)-N(3))-methyltransferase RlmH [Tannerella sp.]